MDNHMQDLLLIHWPGAAHLVLNSPLHAKLRLQTWRVLEDMYTAGRLACMNHDALSALPEQKRKTGNNQTSFWSKKPAF